MKSILKLIIVSNLLLLCSAASYSQQKNDTLDILLEKSWSLIFPSEEEFEYIMQFSQDTIIACLIYEETITLKYEYYLSDIPATVFDSTRIGKNTCGQYIIQRENNKMSVLKIVTLTLNYLKLQNMKDGNIMEFQRKEE